MDRAFLRPGRFGKLIYVSPPSTDERGLILKAIGRKYPIDASVDLGEIGKWKACENFSGADLAALVCLCLNNLCLFNFNFFILVKDFRASVPCLCPSLTLTVTLVGFL